MQGNGYRDGALACLQEKRSGAGRAKEWRRLYVIWWGTAGYKVSKPQKTLASLYQVSWLYINFFQPSFKLKSKTRHGAKVTKRYETPLDRVLRSTSIKDDYPEKDGHPRIESVRGMLSLMMAHYADMLVLIALPLGRDAGGAIPFFSRPGSDRGEAMTNGDTFSFYQRICMARGLHHGQG
ncbi:hypothetical protein [Paraburkholderia sp. JPY419]|uniref:hypothetical protein n=1 Tax=Paraburkholderia sp. JPY419 TaxID=667660 RepID=UPI003D21094A